MYKDARTSKATFVRTFVRNDKPGATDLVLHPASSQTYALKATYAHSTITHTLTVQ